MELRKLSPEEAALSFPKADMTANGTTTPPNILTQPISVLNLTPGVYNALHRSGVTSVELLVPLSAREVESLRNVGATSRRQIETALAKYGLTLQPEKPRPSDPSPSKPPPAPPVPRKPALTYEVVKVALTRADAWDLRHALDWLAANGRSQVGDRLLLARLCDALEEALVLDTKGVAS